MSMKDLMHVAKEFGVDTVKIGMRKEAVIAEIEAEGVTFGAVEAFTKKEEPVQVNEKMLKKDEAVVSEEATLLVKMTRANGHFEFDGYIFEKTKPFAIMPEDAAERLMNTYKGFSLATPSDARAFYG